MVRTQLKRATEKYGPPNSSVLSRALSQPLEKDLDMLQMGTKKMGSLHIDNTGNIDYETEMKVSSATSQIACGDSASVPSLLSTRREGNFSATLKEHLQNDASLVTETKNNSSEEAEEGARKPDAVAIPEDFLCPISLEIMRDPVIVATGQVFTLLAFHRMLYGTLFSGVCYGSNFVVFFTCRLMSAHTFKGGLILGT